MLDAHRRRLLLAVAGCALPPPAPLWPPDQLTLPSWASPLTVTSAVRGHFRDFSVERLMRSAGLVGVRRGKVKRTTIPDPAGKPLAPTPSSIFGPDNRIQIGSRSAITGADVFRENNPNIPYTTTSP